MRPPSTAFWLAVFCSASAFSSRAISSMRSIRVSMLFCTSRTRFSCSAMSPSIRSMLSFVLLTSALSTAARDSHWAASPSAAERRSRARSVSMSLRCIRSLMPSEEA